MGVFYLYHGDINEILFKSGVPEKAYNFELASLFFHLSLYLQQYLLLLQHVLVNHTCMNTSPISISLIRSAFFISFDNERVPAMYIKFKIFFKYFPSRSCLIISFYPVVLFHYFKPCLLYKFENGTSIHFVKFFLNDDFIIIFFAV